MFATLYNDNASIKVFGLGSTAKAAEDEARETIEDLKWEWENYVTVRVSRSIAERIEAGVVEADSLGIDLAPHRSDLGIVR